MASGVFGAIGLATTVGTSAVNYINGNTRIAQNAAAAQQSANNTLLAGQYRQQVSYRNAEVIRAKARMKINDLRRDLYRSKHSLGHYSGVALDSKSISDSKKALDYRSEIDEKLILYDAELDAQNSIETGDMSLWRAANSAGVTLQNSYYNRLKSTTDNNNSLLTSAGNLGNRLLK